MNPQEAYYFEEKEAREKAQAEKMKGKKIVYEWMYKLEHTPSWNICDMLMCEEEAKEMFVYTPFQKTGREFIVEVDDV